MAAKKKSFTVWTAADIGGAGESLVDVRDLGFPEKPSRVQMLTGTPEETVSQLVEKLRKEAKVL
jgi:electron transfer flavoprotein alpha/beta subunit